MASYLYKPWNEKTFRSSNPVSASVWNVIHKVYYTLAFTSYFALFGALWHLYYGKGGLLTLLLFILNLWWIRDINPRRMFFRIGFLMMASFCFGATLAPFLNYFTPTNQGAIIKTLLAGVMFFFCHMCSIYYCPRDFVYKMDNNTAPIILTISMVISLYHFGLLVHIVLVVFFPLLFFPLAFLLRSHRNRLRVRNILPLHLEWIISFLCCLVFYPLQYLVFVYLIVLVLLFQMRTHTQEAIFQAAQSAGETNYFNTAISFYMEFYARIISYLVHTGIWIFRFIINIPFILCGYCVFR